MKEHLINCFNCRDKCHKSNMFTAGGLYFCSKNCLDRVNKCRSFDGMPTLFIDGEQSS